MHAANTLGFRAEDDKATYVFRPKGKIPIQTRSTKASFDCAVTTSSLSVLVVALAARSRHLLRSLGIGQFSSSSLSSYRL